MKLKIFSIFFLLYILTSGSAEKNNYSLRKYTHVKSFYSGIASKATKICLDNNIPPASLLAIAGLESGWNQGYIGKISGNILSLNVLNTKKQLPALYLPTLIKMKRVLFDSLEIKKYNSTELEWKQRPESYKKDYRPLPWRGTTFNLGYFKNHPKEKKEAHLKNITEFVTTFIGRKSKLKVYRNARKKMDSLVKIHGKGVLFKEQTAIDFVHSISGKPNSYNFRKTWPKKVSYIIKRAGLISLTTQLNKGVTFENAWNQK